MNRFLRMVTPLVLCAFALAGPAALAETPKTSTPPQSAPAQTQKNLTKKKRKKVKTVLFEPKSYEKTIVVITKGKEWKYYAFSQEKPLVLQVEGTTVLDFRIRLLFDMTMKGNENFTLLLEEQNMLGLKSTAASFSFSAAKSRVSTVKGEPQLVPSTGDEFKFTVPNGKHTYSVSLTGTGAKTAALRVLIPEKDLKPKTAAKKSGWGFRASLRSRYDDNVFQYSDRNRAAFDPALPKFATLSSVQDVVWMPSATARYRFGDGAGSSIVMSATPRIYSRNGLRNSQTYLAKYDRELPRKIDFDISYLYGPRNFYSRLANPSGQRSIYENAFYGRQEVTASIGKYMSRSLYTGLFGEYVRRNFRSNFNYLDANIASTGARVSVRSGSILRFQAGAGYERSITAGENDPLVNYDVSYREWNARAAINARISKDVAARLDVEYSKRNYTTALVLDRNHFGRRDSTVTGGIELVTALPGRAEAVVGYERIHRTSNRLSANLDFANYDENRAYGEVDFRF